MQRIKAIDVMRGLTVALMIVVNNPGSWEHIYAPLRHAEFNGLTPTDLVFPFFMFIMGVCTCLSLSKYGFKASWSSIGKIVRRTLVIVFIGVLLNACGSLIHGGIHSLDSLRYMGVLQRLGLCYGITALLSVLVNHKSFPYIIAAVLAAYSVLLLLGNGFVLSSENICCKIDTWAFGAKHLYTGDGFPFDPEGLGSTPSAVCQVMIGFLCGKMLMEPRDSREKMLLLLLAGFAMMACGWLLSYGIPVNKKVWSPTFVLVTCGAAMSLLSLMMWTLDGNIWRHSGFFSVFGTNSLFIYVFSDLLGIFDVSGLIYSLLSAFLPFKFASLCAALLFLLVCYLVALPLYRKHIYIRI